MRKTFSLLLAFVSILNFAQINWMTLEDALARQKTEPKKILIDFYATWCAACKIMDKQTYSHPVIAEYINENFYPVKFNAEESKEIEIYGRTFGNKDFFSGRKKNSLHDFTKFMNVGSVPSIVFIDEQAMPITILNGQLSAKELDPYLALISNNDYLKIKTRQQWDDYQKKFKSKIKD